MFWAPLSPAAAAQVGSLPDVPQALARCWRAPPGTGLGDHARCFAEPFGRSSGQPEDHLFASDRGDGAEAIRRLGARKPSSLYASHITDELGQAIAGRPIRIPFRSAPRERQASPMRSPVERGRASAVAGALG
jgi:hypothetical protein